MNEVKKVYAYLRVSGQWQASGHGFDRQLDEIERYCKASKYKIQEVFREQVSGTLGHEAREQFKQLLKCILTNGINTIIVESLDRLARDLEVQLQMLRYLASKNIDVLNARTGENMTKGMMEDPMQKAMIQMQGIFAELDKSLLVNKLRDARERVKKEKGRCEGQKPYGSELGEKEIIEKARYMRRRSRYQEKLTTYREIARRLNEGGYKTRQGKEWTASLVYNILNRNKKK